MNGPCSEHRHGYELHIELGTHEVRRVISETRVLDERVTLQPMNNERGPKCRCGRDAIDSGHGPIRGHVNVDFLQNFKNTTFNRGLCYL
jgi:hypothetical protein